MNQNRNRDKKQEPEKSQLSNPSENYGTEERPSRPKGADEKKDKFINPDTDQDIIRESERSTHTGDEERSVTRDWD